MGGARARTPGTTSIRRVCLTCRSAARRGGGDGARADDTADRPRHRSWGRSRPRVTAGLERRGESARTLRGARCSSPHAARSLRTTQWTVTAREPRAWSAVRIPSQGVGSMVRTKARNLVSVTVLADLEPNNGQIRDTADERPQRGLEHGSSPASCSRSSVGGEQFRPACAASVRLRANSSTSRSTYCGRPSCCGWRRSRAHRLSPGVRDHVAQIRVPARDLPPGEVPQTGPVRYGQFGRWNLPRAA